jgi:hypothetical protein
MTNQHMHITKYIQLHVTILHQHVVVTCDHHQGVV